MRSWILLSTTLFAGLAHATTIYDISTGNTALAGYTGPFAEVQVVLDSSTEATITFTSLTSGGDIFLMGGEDVAGINVNATSWVLGTVTGTNAGTGFSPGPYSDTGSGNVSSFGTFNQTIKSFDGFATSADTISFDLTNTGGTWASDGVVLTANADGNTIESHIFVTTLPADASNGALITGYATDGGGGGVQSIAPEPGSWLLALSGLALLSVTRRFGALVG